MPFSTSKSLITNISLNSQLFITIENLKLKIMVCLVNITINNNLKVVYNFVSNMN
jgi:hypothetical protein